MVVSGYDQHRKEGNQERRRSFVILKSETNKSQRLVSTPRYVVFKIQGYTQILFLPLFPSMV